MVFKDTWRLLLPRALAKQSRISNVYSSLKPSFDGIRAWINNACLWPSNTSLSCLLPPYFHVLQTPDFSFSKHQSHLPIPGEPRLWNYDRASKNRGGTQNFLCIEHFFRGREKEGICSKKTPAKVEWNEEPHTFKGQGSKLEFGISFLDMFLPLSHTGLGKTFSKSCDCIPFLLFQRLTWKFTDSNSG